MSGCRKKGEEKTKRGIGGVQWGGREENSSRASFGKREGGELEK